MRLDRVFLQRFVQSTSFRLAALFALLLVAAFAAAGLGAWIVTRGIAEQQVRETLLFEMDSMQREVSEEGRQAAVLAINSRASRPGALAYRLFAPGGMVLAGDLPVQPDAIGWRHLDLPDNLGRRHGQDDLVVFTGRLSDGSVLAIGGDLERGESVRVAVLHALLWVGLVSACVAMAIGLWLTRRTLRRVDALSNTLLRVSEGNLSARASVRSPTRDDLDHLSNGVNAMLDRIAVLIANVRRVSTDVAHDLRTPLSHLRQDLERGATGGASDAHSMIASAQVRIDGILRTFDAMLRLAEIEAGSGRARFAQVDMRQLVERVTDAYRPDVEAVGGALLTRLEPVWVEGDGDLLAQALANLIENAMTHGGASPHIAVALTRTRDTAELSVSDDGPGIAPDDRERVTHPFVRLDASRGSSGSGLGLAIAAAIARLHGASLVLDGNDPGLRARFLFATPEHA